MQFHVIVMTTVRSCIIRIPIPFSMPVWLREITSHHETFLAESIPYMASHVFTRIVLEGSVSNREIGIFSIEHTETIMMLTSENHVFHTGIFHNLSPLIRVKVYRIQLILQTEIPFLVFYIRKIFLACNPINVFRANWPRFYNTRNRIQAPMKQNTELLVLPFI